MDLGGLGYGFQWMDRRRVGFSGFSMKPRPISIALVSFLFFSFVI